MTSWVAVLLVSGTLLNPSFERAVMAYNSGEYELAIREYEDLVARGADHAAVFYNLGNAYYRAGRLGPAIANYERTLLLDPGMEAARQNLALALGQTQRALQKPLPPNWRQALLFWDDSLTLSASRIMFLGCNLLLWGLLALRLWKPLPYLRTAILAVAVFAGGGALSVWAKSHPISIAVTSVETAPVRYGTSESETVRFELFEGDRVAVEERLGEWIRVRTIDGERGWARIEDFALVAPLNGARPPIAPSAS